MYQYGDQGADELLESAMPDVRAGFVRKVYGILSVQLVVTAVIAAVIVIATSGSYNDDGTYSNNVGAYGWVIPLMYISMVGSIATICALACSPQLARKTPTNYILLGLFTVFESVLVGAISSTYEPVSVLIAVSMTAGIVIGLTLYAMYTKSDFTGFGPYLFGALLAFMLFGLIEMMLLMISPASFYFLRTVYAFLGALIFSMYIVFDTQMIVGGKNRRNQYLIDDYIFAAINIYVDIIQLFLFILELMGDRR
mmetsp:Transcript_44317/g.96394  ORF Transcript_44317/g.96394 Transcript_44317/m.96394 type:complete len:253 (-) Transcript_44317:248-1006(-)|eukprot:CAMPEP_0204272644 /NCGR_PEP_ID=MMETSP0468-20130131/22201_1 /ASSEMBLY_ACC=CAM_ASM_000383 /TAXON_ID=2969 /ORGANISM="Oxyrrhis marina" /LENGTH=252 /DNA_ID=CAMNT_0051248511 /DNA_START=49 /DNA_END=807 /DNA_ORIENTATION=-